MLSISILETKLLKPNGSLKKVTSIILRRDIIFYRRMQCLLTTQCIQILSMGSKFPHNYTHKHILDNGTLSDQKNNKLIK